MKRFSILILLVLLIFVSCEDSIIIETDESEDILVVDAWINNKSESQMIRLTMSQPYFQIQTEIGVSDALVSLVSDSNEMKEFIHQGEGVYIWTPVQGESLGEVGDNFTLIIRRGSDLYQGISTMNRVPTVDSIVIEYKTDEFGYKDGFHAELMARDLLGLGDTYWIKTYKDNVYLNKPEEINITFDGGFDGGAQVDGIVFIPPIRDLVNPFPDEFANGDDSEAPYASGDTIRVEIHSITLEGFQFMNIVKDQLLNGYNTIFSIPLSNTISNMVNVSGNNKILGFFCVSAVEFEEKIIK